MAGKTTPGIRPFGASIRVSRVNGREGDSYVAPETQRRYRPVRVGLPDTYEAMRSGDLKSLAPEDVADWVRRLRRDALERQPTGNR